MEFNRLSERFQEFAETECKGSSELYKELSLHIAKDRTVLELCMEAQQDQPTPNLLLGSVHYLLQKGVDHNLKYYYPSIVDEPKRDGQLFQVFKEFCLEHHQKIKDLLQHKLVQTNEVRRCAYLFPVFSYIYQQTGKPLSFIEIGTSAGLQLLFDQYAYSYGSADIYGKKDSSVHLQSEVREGKLPDHLLNQVPPVHERIGVDLHVSDLTNDEERLWLKALIWPEHTDRLRNFEDAAEELQKNPPVLREGDGVALLPDIAEGISTDTSLCIFHTHVANQLPEDVKKELLQQVEEIGEKREVFHIHNNMEDRQLHIDCISNGNYQKETVGETDGHGRWFDWKVEHYD
ncbi:DUF2332 domain-containing protein [Salimicrobium halophilum]|uniref:DUF2332 domain-containing protein n=1 Tax=Salimicrobium halophilum TaxID=86666 RepID=A0A1G8V8U0_9BACI|nr:DUF2332 domain-containing protein [Salimicrobium halophilum]SDJ62501.1 hypothetical protein SAMN04490247_2578 [Salimicrobium halophilum]